MTDTSRVVEVHGGDAQLAAMAASNPDTPIRFEPDESSDLARALGLRPSHHAAAHAEQERRLDLLRIGDRAVAVNMVVLGHAPDSRGMARRAECRVELDGSTRWEGPASTVVVANGEYLRGLDLVPRGHPADGRLEVHVHALPASQRRGMRARLATGTHVPHPGIRTLQGKSVVIRWARPVRCEVDGERADRVQEVAIQIDPGALRLLA